MARIRRGSGGADPVLLVEAALVLVLFALFVFLFLLPAADPPFEPRWWTWPVLGAVFFSLVGLDAWRRKRSQSGDRSTGRSDSGFPDEPVPPTG